MNKIAVSQWWESWLVEWQLKRSRNAICPRCCPVSGRASQSPPLLRMLPGEVFIVFFTLCRKPGARPLILTLSRILDECSSFEKKVFYKPPSLALDVCHLFGKRSSLLVPREPSISIAVLFLLPPNVNFLIWVPTTIPVFLLVEVPRLRRESTEPMRQFFPECPPCLPFAGI